MSTTLEIAPKAEIRNVLAAGINETETMMNNIISFNRAIQKQSTTTAKAEEVPLKNRKLVARREEFASNLADARLNRASDLIRRAA